MLFTGEACSKGRSDPVNWLLIGLNHGYLGHVVVSMGHATWLRACARAQYVIWPTSNLGPKHPIKCMRAGSQYVTSLDLQAILDPSTHCNFLFVRQIFFNGLILPVNIDFSILSPCLHLFFIAWSQRNLLTKVMLRLRYPRTVLPPQWLEPLKRGKALV